MDEIFSPGEKQMNATYKVDDINSNENCKHGKIVQIILEA